MVIYEYMNKYSYIIWQVNIMKKESIEIKSVPKDSEILELAELFKLFGDETRIRIIYTIHKKELCVSDIANILGMTHSSVSHQLKNLKSARLVRSKKEGKEVFYALNDDHIEKIFSMAMEHIKE